MKDAGMFRVGMIGAGQISEFHLRAVSRIPFARLVGIVDADRSRAEAMCAKWGSARALTSAQELFDAGVDVVHVLTPPSSHAPLTVEALQRGCHVYVEKPMATSDEECARMIAAEKETGRTVCVGHSFLRDPILVRARKILDSGKIGEPLSVQYVRSTVYPKYRGGPVPEMYRLGGYPFRDMGVHGLYIIESILGPVADAQPIFSSTGRDPTVHCDEWTTLLQCRNGHATLHLSWNGRPQQHTVTIYGTRGILKADLYAMYVSVKRARPVPEHLTRVLNSGLEACQMAFGTFTGVAGFALGRVRQYHGLQSLVEEFYTRLKEHQPAPVTPADARSIVNWTERIAILGDQAKAEYLTHQTHHPEARTLVTGGTGLIGTRLVQRLLEEGRTIRLLARRQPDENSVFRHPNVEIILGDLGNPEDVERAVAGVDTVFHLGAALRGAREEFDRGTIVGTQNIVDSCLRHGVQNLIYMSSLSVLHALAGDRNSIITETWPLEPHADLRGNYSRTKLAAEEIVRTAVRERGLRAVMLRPAEVLGDGPPRLTAGVAFKTRKRIIVLGDGSAVVPLVYVEDLIDAILQAERSQLRDGSVFHIVDPVEITQNAMIETYQATLPKRLPVSHFPRGLIRLAGFAGDTLGWLLRRRLPVSSYRLSSAFSPRRFSCELAANSLGWKPRVGVTAILNGSNPRTERPAQITSDRPSTEPRQLAAARSSAE